MLRSIGSRNADLAQQYLTNGFPMIGELPAYAPRTPASHTKAEREARAAAEDALAAPAATNELTWSRACRRGVPPDELAALEKAASEEIAAGLAAQLTITPPSLNEGVLCPRFALK